jgi:argininosuccinate lyase
VRWGVPYRDAPVAVGRGVRAAAPTGRDLAALPLATLQKFSKHIGPDAKKALTPEGSVGARDHLGGTAPAQVRKAIARARKRLAR